MAETENAGSPGNKSTTPTADTVSTNKSQTAVPQAKAPASDKSDTDSDDVSSSLKVVSNIVGGMKTEKGGDNQPDEGNDEGDDEGDDNESDEGDDEGDDNESDEGDDEGDEEGDDNESDEGDDEGDDNEPDEGNDEGDSEGGLVTSVNDMITDSITQLNMEVAGSASAIAMAQLYIATSQSLSLAAENAVANQQHANSLAMAALTKAINNITMKKK